MKKLTTEKCCQLLDSLNSNGMSILEGYYCEALEIALPILEQQGHQSIIADQLDAVRESLELNPHQHAIISCAIDRLNVLTLRTLELSRSLIKQQEQGDGWIEWGGGDRPVSVDDLIVEVKFRRGETERNLGKNFYWELDNKYPSCDIIAYRIIPENSDEN